MFRFCVCHFFIARGLKPTSRDFGPFDMGGWWLQLVLTYCSASCQPKTLSFAKMHCPPWPLMIFSKSRAVCRHAMLYIHTTFYASHPAMNNVFWCPQRAGNQEMLLRSFKLPTIPLSTLTLRRFRRVNSFWSTTFRFLAGENCAYTPSSCANICLVLYFTRRFLNAFVAL